MQTLHSANIVGESQERNFISCWQKTTVETKSKKHFKDIYKSYDEKGALVER